jgi:hypothetical protein
VSAIGRFARFWYDFVIGDDWRIAAGVVIALALTAAVAKTAAPAWLIMPVAVTLGLTWSTLRVARQAR